LGSIFAFRFKQNSMAKANIYYFNPTCELAVANGSFSYQPPLLLQEMERDLSILPFVFCTENDFVLTYSPPSAGFLQTLADAGFNLPKYCRLADLESLPNDSFDTIYPWGWSPAAHFRLKNLKEKCSETFKRSPAYKWTAEHKLLFERSTSLDFLTEIRNNNPPDWFISKEMVGEKVTSCEEIDLRLKKNAPLVLKAPLSSSGRGIQIIRKTQLNTSNRQWISGVLKQQNYLIAEPYLEKLMDLSFQFQVLSDSEVKYLGHSIFETNSNGQYNGTFIHPNLNQFINEENISELEFMIEATAKVLKSALEKSTYATGHQGFLGVDALVFRNQDRLMMQPCIEINSRMNMGVLTMFLERRLHPDSKGKFELFYGNEGEFNTFVAEQNHSNRPTFKEGIFYSGFLPLVEPSKKTKFGAYVSIGVAR
jgi:hypothetical protein